MSITTYDPATGELDKVRTGPTLEGLLDLIGGAAYVEGSHSPLFYRVDIATGEVVAK